MPTNTGGIEEQMGAQPIGDWGIIDSKYNPGMWTPENRPALEKMQGTLAWVLNKAGVQWTDPQGKPIPSVVEQWKKEHPWQFANMMKTSGLASTPLGQQIFSQYKPAAGGQDVAPPGGAPPAPGDTTPPGADNAPPAGGGATPQASSVGAGWQQVNQVLAKLPPDQQAALREQMRQIPAGEGRRYKFLLGELRKIPGSGAEGISDEGWKPGVGTMPPTGQPPGTPGAGSGSGGGPDNGGGFNGSTVMPPTRTGNPTDVRTPPTPGTQPPTPGTMPPTPTGTNPPMETKPPMMPPGQEPPQGQKPPTGQKPPRPRRSQQYS